MSSVGGDGGPGDGRRQRVAAVEMPDAALQRRDPDHLERVDERGLGGVLLRDRQAAHPGRAEAARHGQHAGDGAHRTIEGQFADERMTLEPQRAIAEAQDGHGDGQVEAGPFLGDLGGRQVDGETALRKLEPGVADRGLHALAGLLDGPVGEADDGEVGQAVGDVGLDHHRHSGEAVDAAGGGAGEHKHKWVLFRACVGFPPSSARLRP